MTTSTWPKPRTIASKPKADHSISLAKALPRNRSASVAEAKAHLSSLLNDVETRRAEITLLRRGVAVAKLVPIADAGPATGFGWMRGSAQELGDIIGPTDEEWDVEEE